MKRLNALQFLFIFSLFSLFLACNSGSSTAAPVVAEQGDFTGFEMVNVPGSEVQKATKKDPNGKVTEEGFVKNGQKHGQWIKYGNTDNNLPTEIANFVNGIYSGSLIQFNKRGQIDKVTNYLNNQLDGRYGQYKFGRTVETVNYVNGQMNGVYQKYFDNKDDIQQEITYKNGKMDGFYRYYNEAGEVVLEYEYNNGEKISGGEVKK